MRKLRSPFFSINPKSYWYGDTLIEMAKYADELTAQYDIDTVFTAPYAELYKIAQFKKNLFLTAQGMDGIDPGRGMGAVLPESLKEIGVEAVFLNHAERPMTVTGLVKAMEKAKELDLMTIVCADNVKEASLIATLNPTVIVCEQASLIGTGQVANSNYMKETNEAVLKISPDTLVVQGAGISTGDDIYNAIMCGSDGSGATSGITCSKDPKATIKEMMEAVVRAKRSVVSNGKA